MKLLPLSNSDKVALVDDDVYEDVLRFTWFIARTGRYSKTFYVMSCNKKSLGGDGKIQYLHRRILRTKLNVDHKDGDGLNCQRANLRECTQSQNVVNRKARRYQGVYPRGRKWIAKIMKDYKPHYLGAFPTRKEAKAVYDAKQIEFFGEFASCMRPKAAMGLDTALGLSACVKALKRDHAVRSSNSLCDGSLH